MSIPIWLKRVVVIGDVRVNGMLSLLKAFARLLKPGIYVKDDMETCD